MEPIVHPAFGTADLSNCENELIHLAGSIQPHGMLFVLDAAGQRILQSSRNAAATLGFSSLTLAGVPIVQLGGDLAGTVAGVLAAGGLDEPQAIRCRAGCGTAERVFEGLLHRNRDGLLILEIEPPCEDSTHSDLDMLTNLQTAIEDCGAAGSIAELAERAVEHVERLCGYDRVMFYKFDADDHGEVVAEVRRAGLEPLRGMRYPASDIPQRARELYLLNRQRVLVNVNDHGSPIEPRLTPDSDRELDMSLCCLRSMSPLHLQYLSNMGVTATLVLSLVVRGRLWGLLACHHYSTRHPSFAVRSACEALAETISTRILAIENFRTAEVNLIVRRLEQRLIEATSSQGDWRLALFANPRILLKPLEASGAVLFYDGDMLSIGDVPAADELKTLREWVEESARDGVYSCSSIGRANPALGALTPQASGVLAVRLSRNRADFIVWFRREQLAEVTWAGRPAKLQLTNDPKQLSPRRSFAAWSEIVRGSSAPWTPADMALGEAIGVSLADIVQQVQAVRLLIADHQLTRLRAAIDAAHEPMLVLSVDGLVVATSAAFRELLPEFRASSRLEELAQHFSRPDEVRAIIGSLRAEWRPWQGELKLRTGRRTVPVGVRAEVVPGPDGPLLGIILMFTDLTEDRSTEAARRHLDRSLAHATRLGRGKGMEGVLRAIVAGTSVAAMEISDTHHARGVAPLLGALEASATRAAALARRAQIFARAIEPLQPVQPVASSSKRRT